MGVLSLRAIGYCTPPQLRRVETWGFDGLGKQKSWYPQEPQVNRGRKNMSAWRLRSWGMGSPSGGRMRSGTSGRHHAKPEEKWGHKLQPAILGGKREGGNEAGWGLDLPLEPFNFVGLLSGASPLSPSLPLYPPSFFRPLRISLSSPSPLN